MSEFIVIGPVVIPVYQPKKGGKRIKEGLTEFWDDSEKAAAKTGIAHLGRGKGCFVFGMRGRGIIPYYVGKTTEQILSKEAFESHNTLRYNKLLGERSGTPVMFFVVHDRKRGPTNSKAIKAVEKFLIEQAYERNPKGIINKQHAKPPQWSIRGVIRTEGRGKSSKSAKKFKEMMGFD